MLRSDRRKKEDRNVLLKELVIESFLSFEFSLEFNAEEERSVPSIVVLLPPPKLDGFLPDQKRKTKKITCTDSF